MRGLLSAKQLIGAAGLMELRKDDSGNVIVYVTLITAVLLGITGLALDGSRAMITHSEAQSAADAAALAGASQLDAQAGACARAKAEAAVVVNKQRFAEGGGGNISIAAGSPVCLSNLPASDSTGTGGFATTNDALSKYVQVTTQQLTHQNTLLAAVSTNNTAIIQRTAVAGFHRSLCAAGPVLMACTPFNWQPGVLFDAWASNSGSNKGFISRCGNSANCVQDTLAAPTPQFCTQENEDDPAPGNNTNKAAAGINVRFGQGSTTSEPSDTNIVDFKPYSNELKPTPGTGWDCTAYWAANHASDGFAKPAGCTANSTSLTRYAVYQSERAAGKIPAPGPAGKTAPEERRLLYIAMVDCGNNNATGSYLKAFMLTPAVPGASKNIYVEPIALVTSKTDPNVLHEEVQLYR